MKPSVFAEMTVLFEVPVCEPLDEMSLLEGAYKISDEMTKSVSILIENVTGEKILVKGKDWNTDIKGIFDEDGNLVD
ncbi:hypothetical protein [Robertmurraya siralis]|uniref:hypothetical protein n=1 Tax=Robertmurraya siralis TaxID=77777 RepID=UPI0010F43348|nr:hypothetical protein [Robertmurraya siralis]